MMNILISFAWGAAVLLLAAWWWSRRQETFREVAGKLIAGKGDT